MKRLARCQQKRGVNQLVSTGFNGARLTRSEATGLSSFPKSSHQKSRPSLPKCL